MRFKNFEGKPERENPKKTIFAIGRFGPLQMVSEPDTRQCASEEVEPRRGVDRCANKDAGPQREVNWGSHIDWRRERGHQRGVDCEIPH